jgi:hypothetical protein
MVKEINKGLYHERLCTENKVLHLMFYYGLKLYWMKVVAELPEAVVLVGKKNPIRYF